MAPQPSVDPQPTRDRILQLLRYEPRTVDELVAVVGLTRNGVRAQLAALERDGLARRHGTRHGDGPGKPPQLYSVTERAETELSEAYPPAFSALSETLRERLTSRELRAVFTAAGKRLAETIGAVQRGAAVETAQNLLEALGAAVTVQRDAGSAMLQGAACPLAGVVRRCPESCEMVRSLLAHATGTRIATRCSHGETPRCRFAIG